MMASYTCALGTFLSVWIISTYMFYILFNTETHNDNNSFVLDNCQYHVSNDGNESEFSFQCNMIKSADFKKHLYSCLIYNPHAMMFNNKWTPTKMNDTIKTPPDEVFKTHMANVTGTSNKYVLYNNGMIEFYITLAIYETATIFVVYILYKRFKRIATAPKKR